MSINMFQGSELEAVLGATSLPQFLAGVTTTYNEVIASRPADRISRQADEIAAAEPDLVGLQEAALWRTSPTGPSPMATNIAFDLIQLLVAALAAKGEAYSVVSMVTNLDVEAPSSAGFWLRFTDRVAVLARSDRSGGTVSVSNARAANYVAKTVFTSPAIGPVAIPDGWASVDARIRGQSFRFITTHLASIAVPVQVAEGAELATVGTGDSLPVVIAGDFNSAAAGGPDLTPTYSNMLAAGYTDGWALTQNGEPGFTCCHLGGLALSERIDLVLTRGAVQADSMEVVGISSPDQTPTGLWPSDHGALVAELQVGR